MSTLIQRSFAGGEIAPKLQVRADLERYFNSLRKCRNVFIQKHGGGSNRSGTQFCGHLWDNASQVKLVDFVFNNTDAYSLEFGHQIMRVVKEGSYVTLTAKNITGITIAATAVFTSAAHGYSNADQVYITGIAGQLGQHLNGRYGQIAVLDPNTYSLYVSTPAGSVLFDSTGLAAYTSGGTTEQVYQITTPYTHTDLSLVNYDQSGDTITLVHPDYPVVEIQRAADDSWVLSYPTFQPDVTAPFLSLRSIASVGPDTEYYQVTALKEDGEESYPAFYQIDDITGITQASPAVVTFTVPGAYSYSPAEGDLVMLTGILGMTQLNNKILIAKNVTGATVELYNLDGTPHDSTTYTAWSSGGKLGTNYIIAETDPLSSTDTVFLQWTFGGSETLEGFNVYRLKNGLYGLIGVTNPLHRFFTDVGVDPDTSISPPIYSQIFNDDDKYPGTLAYYQQRRIFARTNDVPEGVDVSGINYFSNFFKSRSIQDDDAFSFKLRGKRPSEIRHLIDIGKLIIFTGDGEWSVDGDQGGALTPTTINVSRQSYNGSSYIAPIVVDDTALYIQARGNVVRTLGFDFQSDGYRGNDISIFATHLFEGHEIVDWAYQQNPHSIVWVVRDDGILLGCTFVREQEILAWHRHDLDGGIVESICSIPEGSEDVIYMIVKRKINGRWEKYHERLSSRYMSDEADAIVNVKFCDSYLTYDGTNTGSTTMTLSGGTGWLNGQPLTLTASASFFASTDVGNKIKMLLYEEDDYGVDQLIDSVVCEITGYTSATVVTVNPEKTVPVLLRTVAKTTWIKQVDEIQGLWHLEGKDVSVQGDGYVVASPFNSEYPTITVEDGTITLDECYGIIHVGLPYISDIETLAVDTTQSETMIDKHKLFGKINAFVEKTNSFWAGPAEPSEDDPLENMQQVATREPEDDPEAPPVLRTKKLEVTIRSKWTPEGRVFLRQVDPSPLSIQAIAPSGYVPMRGK